MYKPPNKLECDITESTKQFEQMQGPVATFVAATDAMMRMTLELFPLWQQLTQTCLHLHDKHYHTISSNAIHDVNDTSVGGNACITSSFNGAIDALTSEQNSFTDLRETGMIFGRDYAFENTLDLPRFYKTMYSPDVNEFSEEMMQSLENFESFVNAALTDLFLPADQKCIMNTRGIEPSQLLMTEFFKEEDVDGDGKIYGEDFIIEDINAPSEIIELNKSNDIKGKSPDIEVVTWKDYLESFEPVQVAMECQISPFTKKELVDELIEEFLTCKDQNNDQLIYGKDFVIVGDDKPTQLNQYVPLYLPKIVTTWTSYVKSREYNQPNNIDKYKTLLQNEYDQNQDLDGNGLIYGIDFIIQDECLVLDIVGNDSCSVFTLKEYDNTIKSYIENYVLDENIQAAKFNAEWLDQQDVDGNNLIYGKDFVLTDYEGNKTECLWTIERYRKYTLSWTPEKIAALNLHNMISDYTQGEFDQYWLCANLDNIYDGPGNQPESTNESESNDIVLDYSCDSATRPLIPLEFNAYDLSGHLILYDGNYWYDLGIGDVGDVNGQHKVPDGTLIDLTGLVLNRSYDLFLDSNVYYIKNLTATPESPYVFQVIVDGRKRVYPSDRFFSVVHECLEFNEVNIAAIESLTETHNYIILNDTRSDKVVPFDKDLTGYMVRWLYDADVGTGKWVLSAYYERVVNRVILIDDEKPQQSVCVPMYKESDEFNHFLPYVLNVTWNDL